MESLTPVQEKFILHWGEMGTRWGINRTVAQIHALLYLSPEPNSSLRPAFVSKECPPFFEVPGKARAEGGKRDDGD